MNTTPAPERHTDVLLLPANEDILGPLLRLEEPLLLQLRPLSQDQNPEDWELPELPPGLDGEAVYQAYTRVLFALPAELRDLVRTGEYKLPSAVQPIGPDGRWEHTPLYLVEVASKDVTLLASLVTELQRALRGEPGMAGLQEILGETADWRTNENRLGERVTSADVVRDAERAVAVLLQEQDHRPELPDKPIRYAPDASTEKSLSAARQSQEDAALLTALVRAAQPGERVVLTPAQEAAYRRFADTLIRATAASVHDAALTRFAI